MIPWDWIKDRKINFEPGITCRLKCPGCYMRADGMSKTKNPIDYNSMAWDRRYNIPLEKYKVIFDVFDEFEFCGNLSDPIYHPDFIETLKYLKGKNLEIIFRTNGSGKSAEWWTEVFELCSWEKWRWVFALDGLPKDSNKYRINQDGDRRLSYEEFVNAAPIIGKWGIDMSNPAAQWRKCDSNGAGMVLFDEFCNWAIKTGLDLDDDDDNDRDEGEGVPNTQSNKKMESMANRVIGGGQ